MANEKLLELINERVCFGSRVLIDAMRGRLPDRPGVYILIHPEHGVLYVGKAMSLKKRCKRRAWYLGSSHVAWVGLKPEDLDMAERYLIKLCKPAYNIVHNKGQHKL